MPVAPVRGRRLILGSPTFIIPADVPLSRRRPTELRRIIMRRSSTLVLLITSTLLQVVSVRAEDRLDLDSVPAPTLLDADEPLARSFSLESAARTLDISALHWQKTQKCAACHTM